MRGEGSPPMNGSNVLKLKKGNKLKYHSYHLSIDSISVLYRYYIRIYLPTATSDDKEQLVFFVLFNF